VKKLKLAWAGNVAAIIALGFVAQAALANNGNECTTVLVGDGPGGVMWPDLCGGTCASGAGECKAVVGSNAMTVYEWKCTWDPNANHGLGGWVWTKTGKSWAQYLVDVAFCGCVENGTTSTLIGVNYCCTAVSVKDAFDNLSVGTTGLCDVPGCDDGECTLHVSAFGDPGQAIATCDD
jgi:hypothetical protein